MKITVRPEWTFRDAVNAAWQAYSGGREHGVPNRIRVLEQWANVVGRARAQSELEATLGAFPDLSTASEELGFSIYALKKLRRSFAQMPTITPHVAPAVTFEEFLKRLPELDGQSEIAFTIQVVPHLAAFLGYTESETYFESAIGGNLRFRMDAILAPAGPAYPHVVLELKGGTGDGRFLKEAIAQVNQFRQAAGAPLGVVLSPHHIAILSGGAPNIYSLNQLAPKDANDIMAQLRRPNTVELPSPTPANLAVKQLQNMLDRVSSAQTNDEKKIALEDLAANTFEVHEFLNCKYRNLRTRSSEVDIVCEVVGSGGGEFLREYGRYFLVECKNWAVPAGAKEIRDFLGKLRKCRVRLGIYFSRNGITGEQHGTDALREIHSAFDQDGTCIIVISAQELSALRRIEDALNVVDEKLDALRFDF